MVKTIFVQAVGADTVPITGRSYMLPESYCAVLLEDYGDENFFIACKRLTELARSPGIKLVFANQKDLQSFGLLLPSGPSQRFDELFKAGKIIIKQ
ncbi:MAG: hypothetical protein WC916_03790 [Candidatus Woesearchaeota archaeon]